MPAAGAARRHPSITAPRAWTLVACLAFLIATAYAIAVVVFRLPLPGLQEPRLFRIALALHVELAVYFWLMATAAASWSAASPVPGRTGRLAVAAGIGTVLLALSPLAGGAPVMADYFPWLAGNPLFSGAFALFTVAVLGAAGAAVWRTIVRSERAAWDGVGLTALPVVAAGFVLAGDIFNGARSLADLAWGAGHTLLFGHLALMCWEWGRLATPEGAAGGRVQRGAAATLAGFSLLLMLIPFVFPPGSGAHQVGFTLAMSWLLWPPAAVAAGATLLALRRHGATLEPSTRLALQLSMVFFVIGCGLGALIDGPTTLVTAHYHAAIGAVALSRMAMLYHAAPELALARAPVRAAKRQIAIYATALALLFSGLAIGAIDAAPRKTSAGELSVKGPYFRLGMSISGVGGLFAIAGSLWLVINLTRPTGGRRTSARNGSPD